MHSFRRSARVYLLAALVGGLVLASGLLLLWPSAPDGGRASRATAAPSAPSEATVPPSDSIPGKAPTGPAEKEANDGGLPHTLDYRALAAAAAQRIYTWDTRRSSYSDVYSRIRDWWELLPDGSNPLTVLAREFESTGVTASTFADLADQGARRTGVTESLRCDHELAKVRDYPAPWAGLHVCTVTVRVKDESNNGRRDYLALVSVMVNCPPAAAAPIDRCAMVGFYADPDRIVY
ncbi:hypothetical protein [Arthrobacter sp. M4]|uniref:hypothetical protein n=1 Tax=Arthrobacter sp. M4 TaxID=218160 RepID=UPI001CDD7EF9|nr:hypothetical protein [Arthrobacter sp. M4]MCA4132650.1 hypothetical protein [Arthrobacter sp. M4]